MPVVWSVLIEDSSDDKQSVWVWFVRNKVYLGRVKKVLVLRLFRQARFYKDKFSRFSRFKVF